MTIDESDLREALDQIDKQRETFQAELLTQEEWVPAAHRHDSGRLTVDLQTMTPDLTKRELQMWQLGRVEARGKVLEELGDALLDGYELGGNYR